MPGNDVLIGGGIEEVSSEPGALAFRLYQAAFDRLPDSVGFAGWTEKLESGEVSRLQAASGFVASPEFQNTYGALDNAAFVTLLYANVLDRAPDAGGLSGWTARLDEGMSRAQVFLGFADSPELRAATNDAASAYVAQLDSGPPALGLTMFSGSIRRHWAAIPIYPA